MKNLPMRVLSHPQTNSRMTTMMWPCANVATAADLARTVETLLQGALVWMDELPLWQTCYHVAAKSKSDGSAYVKLWMWPQPEEPAVE